MRPGGYEPSALARAARQAARFDRSAVSLRAGVVAAIPVVGVLAVGTLAGQPVGGVTAGAGAMLVGIAWRVGGGMPPVATMVTDAAFIGLSTFAGSASGRLGWLHFALLVAWSCAAGLIVAVGRRTAVVGTQALIAFVVFGRFSEPIPQAAALAGLVLAGGATQVVFSAIFGAPAALRVQRTAVAEAYRRLATVASDSEVPAGNAAAALDEADAKLSTPTLLGDAAATALSALVQEGRRMRLELAALALLHEQYARAHPGRETAVQHAAARVRASAVGALRCIAAVAEGAAPAGRLQPSAQALDAAIDELTHAARAHDEPSVTGVMLGSGLAESIEHHTAALAGQVRAAAGFAAGVHEGRGRITVRPSLGSWRPWQQFAADLAQMRANVSLRSPAGRHAVRLGVIVPATWVLSQHLPLQRGYWIPVAAATVLRPDFGGTFTRGAERMAGTCVGVIAAGLVAVALHPTGWGTVAIVGILACGAYSLFAASFTAGVAFLNAMIVFLLEAVAPSTLSTATDRGIDTIIGGTIGLTAYALWPTWSSTSARQALAEFAQAQHAYVHAVLRTSVEGRRAAHDELRPRARRERETRTNAEAALERALSDPQARRIDVGRARRVMTAFDRLVQAAHVIRLELDELPENPPPPELRPLVEAIDHALAAIEAALVTELGDGAQAHPGLPALPALRALHRALSEADTPGELDPVLLT